MGFEWDPARRRQISQNTEFASPGLSRCSTERKGTNELNIRSIDSDVGSPPGVYHYQQIALNPVSYGNESPFIGVGFVIRNCYSKVKKRYDFSKGNRGRILPGQREARGKKRITIRIDDDLMDHFLKEADAAGGAVGYQTLINEALRHYVQGTAPKFEDTLRRIVREEVRSAN